MWVRSSVQPQFLGGYASPQWILMLLSRIGSIPWKVKAHEVHAMATSLQLFNKVAI